MLILIEELPVEIMGTNVLGYLYLQDIVMLERACGSKTSHQLFLNMIPYCFPVTLPIKKYNIREALDWFVNRRCKLSSLTIKLPGDNPCLHVKNLQVEYFDLHIKSSITLESLQPLLDNNIAHQIKSIDITENQNREVIEQLSNITWNVTKLSLTNSTNFKTWLSAATLTRWKLTEINLSGWKITTTLIMLIVQTCTELTTMKLYCDNIDDSAVIAIAQHCPQLETLHLTSRKLTSLSLLSLSERGLPIKQLDIPNIPNIPTADIARRCSHALSCIRHQRTIDFHMNFQDANILIPYLTGLTSVCINFVEDSYIPLLAQHCHKLTMIKVSSMLHQCSVGDILPLCRANPLLQEFIIYAICDFTDTTLIELIHACPHLHTLDLLNEPNITDIGILALSEHCTQLQWLSMSKCHKVTEAAVLQLLQRCRKLTRLEVSSSSLSEETWTQLDKNTQKRVRRW